MKMIRLIAQYRIKEGAYDSVQEAIKRFILAVKHEEPETQYEAYNLANSNEFIHIMAFPNESAQRRHQKASYTLEFVETLYPNCVNEPKFTPITKIEKNS